MWQANSEQISDRTEKFTISMEGNRLSYSSVLELWKENAKFCDFFSELIAGSTFKGYRWETPGVTAQTVNQPFEFVLLQCDRFNPSVDTKSFASYFSSTKTVVTFPNIGKNAMLVVPCPVADISIYGHLASFIRHAPQSQTQELWQSVAAAMESRLGERPVWLSTAGLGVSWLHVRLDDRPKYYGYTPYKTCKVDE